MCGSHSCVEFTLGEGGCMYLMLERYILQSLIHKFLKTHFFSKYSLN